MNENLLKQFADGAKAWLEENRDSDQPDEVGHELVEELDKWVGAGAIEVEASNDAIFSMIEENYPVSGNKIDWGKVAEHQMVEFRPTKTEQIDCEVLRERLKTFRPELDAWLSSLDVSPDEVVSFVGDGSEITLKMTIGVFLECYPILLEQPQHSYLLPSDGKWCLNYTLDSELFLGLAANATVKGWIEE